MLRAESPTSGSRLLRRSSGADWRQSLALLVAMALLLGGFNAVIQGGRWWTTTIMLTAVVLATCAILRAVGSPLSWLGGVVVWFVGLVWIFVPDTLWTVLPTPSSVGALYQLWADAKDIIWVEASPVAPAKPIIFLVAAAFVGLAIVLDELQLSLRSPVSVGAIFTAMYVVPTAVSGEPPNLVLFLGIAASWLYLLRSELRHRAGSVLPPGSGRTVPAVAIAAAALAVSVTLPPALPHVSNIAVSWGQSPPGAFARGINPILQLGQNLRRNSAVTALEYTTTADDAPYLKVANLLDFDGKTWKPVNTVKYGRIEGPNSIDRDIETKEVTTSIAIKSLNSPRLPVPYPATKADGLEGEWRWEPHGLTLKSAKSSSSGQTYKITSLQVEPTRTQMRESRTFIGPTLTRYLDLPDDMPDSIAETAEAITNVASNDYDRAIALQTYFRNGSFTYSESAPVAEGYDGNGVDVIAEFLKAKAGYCIHFSSAMAVMAREVGIPARIAVGYAPGSEVRRSKAGNPIFQTSSNDLHAWPELFFQGIGWIGFEPTPGVGTSTAFEDEFTSDQPDVDPDVAAEEDTGPSNRPEDNLLDSAPAAETEGGSSTPALLAGLGGLLLILLIPLGIRSVQRAWYLRPKRRTAGRLWVELQNTGRDVGLFVTQSDTPRAFAAQLAAWPGIDGEALSRMLHAVELERFGPPARGVDDIDDFRAVVASIRAGSTRAQRIRAALMPRSIFGQATYAPRPHTA